MIKIKNYMIGALRLLIDEIKPFIIFVNFIPKDIISLQILFFLSTIHIIYLMTQVSRYTLLLIALATFTSIVASVHLSSSPISNLYPKKVGDHFVGQRKKDGSQFPIYVIGGDDKSFFPKPQKSYITEKQEYDVVVLGGGLSGLTASLYLTDHDKKVLLLEKEKSLGGLASWRQDKRGFSYDRGAAYWTKAYNEEFQIMKHIGISRYFTEYIIPQPIDAYFWNGIIYGAHPHQGLWDDRCLGIQVPAKHKNGTSLPVLPSSFGIFKFELLNANNVKLVPDQPFQKAKRPDLDKITAAQWIRSMPETFRQRISKPGLFARERRLLARFQQQIKSGKLKKQDPMIDVLNFMQLYCRSALGADTDELSAMGYANFYTSQVQPRFTTPFGSGVAAKTIYQQLVKMPNLITLKTETFFVKLRNTATGVEVDYVEKGVPKTTRAKKAIFAAQMSMAPNIIEGLEQKQPEQAKIMRDLKFTHYSIHNVEITNHPYRQAYDTWTRARDYTVNDFSDVINGRWAQLKGYREHQLLEDFEKNPDGKGNSISIYHPLLKVSANPVDQKTQIYTDEYCAQKANFAFNRFQQLYKDYLKQDFKVLGIYTSRWPYSVHVPKKFHFSVNARKVSKTFGNIVFGNSNIGTPSFEQALFRGHCAANKILYRFDPKFVQQSWSKCEYQL